MSSSSSSSSSGGMGLASVLTIVFVVLKLVGTIDWSWWWVLSPLWIGLAIFAIFGIIALIFIAVTGAGIGIGSVLSNRKRR